MHRLTRSVSTVLLALPLGLLACTAEAPPESADAGADAAVAGADILLAALPDDVVAVGAAKPTAAEGDVIALHGRIGGHRDPMTGDAGMFLMVDLTLKHCGETGDKGCPAPWDYCCEPAESMVANNATVQLVDADGAPLVADFTALGLQPLDEVVVVGTVAARPSPEVLLVNATGVHKVAGADQG